MTIRASPSPRQLSRYAPIEARIAMVKAMVAPFGDRVVVEPEPFEGIEGFFQKLRPMSPFPVLTVTGEDGFLNVPKAVLDKKDRTWVVVERPTPGTRPNRRDADAHWVSLPGIGDFSSTAAREQLAKGTAAPFLPAAVREIVESRGLYREPGALRRAELEREYAESCRAFLGWLGAEMPAPPFKATQSKEAWLEKFVAVAVRHFKMAPEEARRFAARAKERFAKTDAASP